MHLRLWRQQNYPRLLMTLRYSIPPKAVAPPTVFRGKAGTKIKQLNMLVVSIPSPLRRVISLVSERYFYLCFWSWQSNQYYVSGRRHKTSVLHCIYKNAVFIRRAKLNKIQSKCWSLSIKCRFETTHWFHSEMN